MNSVPNAPRQTVLPSLYRIALRMTRRHGAGTLSRFNHRMFPAGQIISLATGTEFFVPPDPHFFGYIVEHEKHISRVITDEVSPGDCCVDVGANIGYFAASMIGRCGASGRVVAYEPEARNFGMLQVNAQLAEARGLRIECIRAAVSDHPGTLALVRGQQSTLHQVTAAGKETPAEDLIPCVNLSEDLQSRGVTGEIKLLKIDVEGHEVAVLKGCADLFASRRVRIAVIEVTPGQQATEIDAIFRKFGATTSCWLDGQWRNSLVAELPYRTDILVRF